MWEHEINQMGCGFEIMQEEDSLVIIVSATRDAELKGSVTYVADEGKLETIEAPTLLTPELFLDWMKTAIGAAYKKVWKASFGSSDDVDRLKTLAVDQMKKQFDFWYK